MESFYIRFRWDPNSSIEDGVLRWGEPIMGQILHRLKESAVPRNAVVRVTVALDGHVPGPEMGEGSE